MCFKCELENSHESLLDSMLKVASRSDDFKKFKGVIEDIRSKKGKSLFVAQSEDEKRVTYAPKPEYKFDLDRRQKTTLGRYLKRNHKKILNEIDDKSLDKFVAQVISKLTDVEEFFKIVDGEEIEEAYKSGIGSRSCMTGNCSSFTRFYAENSDKIQMLLYNDTKGRALLWTTDDDVKLIDRIYPNDGQHIALYEKWAKQHGFHMRSHQGLPEENTRFLGVDDWQTVTLKAPSNDRFPYMDTFKYGIRDGDKIILGNAKDFDWTAILDNTSGRWHDIRKKCEKCGKLIYRDYLININDKYYCTEHTTRCGCCNYPVLKEKTKKVLEGLVCEKCFEKRCSKCDCCDEYGIARNQYETNNGKLICHTCKIDNYVYCNGCNGLFLIENTIKPQNSYCFCAECFEKEFNEDGMPKDVEKEQKKQTKDTKWKFDEKYIINNLSNYNTSYWRTI